MPSAEPLLSEDIKALIVIFIKHGMRFAEYFDPSWHIAFKGCELCVTDNNSKWGDSLMELHPGLRDEIKALENKEQQT